jgi:hypothetical protein
MNGDAMTVQKAIAKSKGWNQKLKTPTHKLKATTSPITSLGTALGVDISDCWAIERMVR